MKISITRSRLEDFCHISDEQQQLSESEKRLFKLIRASDKSVKIQLIFIDGSKTMKAFKEMYLRDMSVCFQVKNMELFMAKSRMFRHLELSFLEDLPPKKDDREKRYVRIAKKFGGDLEKGLQISFRPQVYDGIRTSLLCPGKYLSQELPCHRIIQKLLEKNRTHEEMCLDTQGEDALRSLIFSGIVVRKSDTFELADWMRNSPQTKRRERVQPHVIRNVSRARTGIERNL